MPFGCVTSPAWKPWHRAISSKVVKRCRCGSQKPLGPLGFCDRRKMAPSNAHTICWTHFHIEHRLTWRCRTSNLLLLRQLCPSAKVAKLCEVQGTDANLGQTVGEDFRQGHVRNFAWPCRLRLQPVCAKPKKTMYTWSLRVGTPP